MNIKLVKKLLPKSISNPSGFTLIELLIVITIIAVLATIGFAVYAGLNTATRSRNAVRRSDLDAIAKALEINKTSGGNYIALANSQFANATIPTKDPQGYVYCANTDSTIPAGGLTAASTASACTPSGAGNYSPISTSFPPAGSTWKICTWLEDDDGTGPNAATSFCKISAQ